MSTAEYAEHRHWERRYEQEPTDYDWLLSFADLADLIREFVRESDALLVPGCGNAPFSPDLYDGGFCNQTAVDFSSVVIDQTTYVGKQPSASRKAPKGKQHGISPGTPVQVYSKSKGIWCQGTVVRMVNREAAEVAYHPGSRRDKEPRRKVLRVDSENLRWDTAGQVP